MSSGESMPHSKGESNICRLQVSIDSIPLKKLSFVECDLHSMRFLSLFFICFLLTVIGQSTLVSLCQM
jgi:hypothetical protein